MKNTHFAARIGAPDGTIQTPLMTTVLQSICGPGIEEFRKVSLPDIQALRRDTAANDPDRMYEGYEGEGSPRERGRESVTPLFRLSPPDIKIFSAGGIPILRGEHPVRDSLELAIKVLSRFSIEGLQPRTNFGFAQQDRAEPDIKSLTIELTRLKVFFEQTAQERSDGLPPSLLVRNIAGQAAGLLEHFLIDLIADHRVTGPTQSEILPLLHMTTEIKDGLRKLLEHFDMQIFEIAAQAGMFGELKEKLEQKETGTETEST